MGASLAVVWCVLALSAFGSGYSGCVGALCAHGCVLNFSPSTLQSLTLGSLYLYKLYIARFRPERNVTGLNFGAQSSKGGDSDVGGFAISLVARLTSSPPLRGCCSRCLLCRRLPLHMICIANRVRSCASFSAVSLLCFGDCRLVC